MIQHSEILHFHLYAGLGGGAAGFNQGEARVGNLVAKFRCLGGVDNDPAAIRDFERLAGVPGTVLDLFSRDQYVAFHGHQPPEGWREAAAADIRRAAGNERPNIVFLSAPCKGFSGLLSESRSKSAKYQALNELALRGLLLALEAWKDDPPEFFLFENVPRIATRGRHLLDQIEQLLSAYGYASAETTHDCGELGNLAQSRKRFLLVARHVEKVPPFLYEPPKHPLRAVGDVLGRMALPGDPAAGPMHRVPLLHWRTWVRLAFVEAGSDWRSLQKLAVVDGFLRDYAIEQVLYPTTYGVQRWEDPSPTVTANSRPGAGAFSVADPRVTQSPDWNAGQHYGLHRWEDPSGAVTGQAWPNQGRFALADPRFAGAWPSQQFGVNAWDEPAPTMTSQRSPGQGRFAVADPRMGNGDAGPKFNNCYRVVRIGDPSSAITAGAGPTAGGLAVADPRTSDERHRGHMGVRGWDQPVGVVSSESRPSNGAYAVADPRAPAGSHGGKYRVTEMGEASGTVIAESGTGNGAFAVADPRPRSCPPAEHDPAHAYQSSGSYGVVPWDRNAGAIAARMSHDNSPASVADPRDVPGACPASPGLPALTDRLVAVIRALDGTWHRPFTTLELAALQGLVDPEEQLELDGLSDSAWRERIGNAVPGPAAKAIASEIGRTLLLARTGETFQLGSTPIWVRPTVVGLMAARRRLP